jgi:hypothetical protein
MCGCQTSFPSGILPFFAVVLLAQHPLGVDDAVFGTRTYVGGDEFVQKREYLLGGTA